MVNEISKDPASFKDPAGFVFQSEGKFYRQVNHQYAAHYDHLMNSGLYAALVEKKWLLPHAEIQLENVAPVTAYKILLPEQLSFVSYPYEWSFDMLKDAALLSLQINGLAIEYGMVLKDATPFNVQLHNGSFVFIDTLSFEKYDETKPWIAFRQFCETFLSPLFLGHYIAADLNKLLSNYIDGIPVAFTAKLLPARCRFSLAAWLYFYLPGMIRNENSRKSQGSMAFSKEKLQRMLQHLIATIKKLGNKNEASEWENYYSETIISQQYLQEKEKIFLTSIDTIAFSCALDIGANDGHFSLLLTKKARVIAADFDHVCINRLYRIIREKGPNRLTPLVIDLSNPTPALGFGNTERKAFLERCNADLLVALALIHHLVFSKNIPLEAIAAAFAKMTSTYLIIEFVPFDDVKVQELVKNKTSFHQNYNDGEFEEIFSHYFRIEMKEAIADTGRILYRMTKRS